MLLEVVQQGARHAVEGGDNGRLCIQGTSLEQEDHDQQASPNNRHKAAPYLAVLSVEGTNEHVVGDVIQVTSVLQPWACHGDVVSGALALGLDQHHGICDVAANGLEGLQDLQPLAVWGDCYIKVALWVGCLVCLLTCTRIAQLRRYRTQSHISDNVLSAAQGCAATLQTKMANSKQACH